MHNFDVAYSVPEIASRTAPGRYTFLDQMVVGVAPNGHGDNGHKGGVRELPFPCNDIFGFVAVYYFVQSES